MKSEKQIATLVFTPVLTNRAMIFVLFFVVSLLFIGIGKFADEAFRVADAKIYGRFRPT